MRNMKREKKEERKEKKTRQSYLCSFFIFIFSFVLFTACDNSIDTPDIQEPVKNGYGKVSVSFTGEAARTVLPSTAFDKYVYTFTKAGETNGVVKAFDNEGFFTLEVGSYTVAVQAYIGTAEPYTLAASGVSSQFSVGSGDNDPVTVRLSEITAAAKGEFSYTITYPAGAAAEITLQKWPELNTIALDPVNVTQGNGKTQTLELSAGSYLLTVLVSKNNLYAGISEAVRIYPSVSTVYTENFVDDDLIQAVAPILTLTASNTKITYTWTSSIPAADSYDVYWKVGSGLTVVNVKTGTKITGAVSGGEITGLTNGTAYSVVVTANKASNSLDSAVRTETPSLATFIIAPTLTLTAGNAKITYTWTASNPVADSYDIYWKAGNGLSAADVKTGTKITGAVSGEIISELTNGTAYSVIVTANKAGYNSVDSVVRTGRPIINAVQPVINAQPQGGTFFKTGTLSVTASVTDGGILTYQWYKNTSNSTIGGTAISGATGSSYTLSDEGTLYCYVIVTNTITNNGDGGTKTAQSTSITARVTIELVQAVWARTVSAGNGNSYFNAVAVDSSGNVYAAGCQYGNGTYIYGTGVSAQGQGSSKVDVVLVKYNSSGTALWVRTVSAGNNTSSFRAVAVDSSGNVYAAGNQGGNGTYTYGTGVSAQGVYSDPSVYYASSNVVLVKYNSSGTAEWARTVSAGNNISYFNAVAVDSSGNVYAAGYQYGNGTYIYGTGVSAQGTCIGGNVVLVKYNSSGTAEWARTIITGGENNGSIFNAVAVDSSGNVYAAGYQYGNGTYIYGTGVSAQGTSSGNNVVLVKYNSSGTAEWARTVSVGNAYSSFIAVAVDSSGNVYAAGNQSGNGTYTYGTGVSAQGTSGDNVVLVKYNSSGTALWVRTVREGNNNSSSNISSFNAVAVDSSGNVYAAGHQDGNGTYTYGTGVSAQGTSSGNVVLVKYDSGGTAQWAQSTREGNAYSIFDAVAVDSSGNVYAAGSQNGNGTFTYGTGVSAQGTSSINVVLVKYRE